MCLGWKESGEREISYNFGFWKKKFSPPSLLGQWLVQSIVVRNPFLVQDEHCSEPDEHCSEQDEHCSEQDEHCSELDEHCSEQDEHCSERMRLKDVMSNAH